MQIVISRFFTYLFIALLLSMGTGCSSFLVKEFRAINIPDNIRNGECEKGIPELSGPTARELVELSTTSIDKIAYCRLEKRLLIKYIDEYNSKIVRYKI